MAGAGRINGLHDALSVETHAFLTALSAAMDQGMSLDKLKDSSKCSQV